MIPCLAASRHQGKVQLPLNTLQKKTIVVAGFSSSQFYFDFHIKKKISSRHRKKNPHVSRNTAAFWRKAQLQRAGCSPGVILSLSQHRQSSITPTPPCPGLAASGAGSETLRKHRLGRERYRGVFQRYPTPRVVMNSGFPETSRAFPQWPAEGRTAGTRTGAQLGGHRHSVTLE